MDYSITQNGEPLDKSKYTIDEEAKTFSTTEDDLVLDFSSLDGWTFRTGSHCTFDTGSYCTFDTGSGCTFKTGLSCTFKTGSYCTFDTLSGCTFKTGLYCTFNTGSYCTFNTGWACTFKTGSGCTFKTGWYCTFNTVSGCTFVTEENCVVVRRDMYEVIELDGSEKIKLNGYGEAGYEVVEDEPDEPEKMVEIGGKRYSKATLKEALKQYVE